MRPFILVVLFSIGYGIPVSRDLSEPKCRHAAPTENDAIGINRISDVDTKPLIQLSVTKSDGYQHTVRIQLFNKLLSFTDAILSIEANGSCGAGELHYSAKDFLNVTQALPGCPLLLATNRKVAMQELPPLLWKAPTCGCVLFRAMVIEDAKIYYADRLGVVEGPLSTKECTNEQQTHQLFKPLTREERIGLLCQVMQRFSGADVRQRSEFMQRHLLGPSYVDKSATELALLARRNDITECCSKGGHKKLECFHDIRRRRVDTFCEDGFPDIPFTESRTRFMRDREQACCWRIGAARYDCFSVHAAPNHGSTSAEYSMDESDPVNDLGDYPDEILQIEKGNGVPLFSQDEPKAEPTANSASIPTTTRIQTTLTTSTTITTTAAPVPPVTTPSADKHGRVEGNQTAEIAELSATYVSRELGEEQGRRSIDKTFSRLQQKMWKLSLKTLCCKMGMQSARKLYGDFHAVWDQCTHSADKFITTQDVVEFRKACSNQFHRCCVETAFSTPAEVVTWHPDPKSSAEWDPHRDQLHKQYLPPHARQHGATPQALESKQASAQQGQPEAAVPHSAAQRESVQPEAPGRSFSQNLAHSARLQQTLNGEEADLEEPLNKRHPGRKPVSRVQAVPSDVKPKHRNYDASKNRNDDAVRHRSPQETQKYRTQTRHRDEDSGKNRNVDASRHKISPDDSQTSGRYFKHANAETIEEPTSKQRKGAHVQASPTMSEQYRKGRNQDPFIPRVDAPEFDEEPMTLTGKSPHGHRSSRKPQRQEKNAKRLQDSDDSMDEDIDDDIGKIRSATSREQERQRRHRLEQEQLRALMLKIEQEEEEGVGPDADDADLGSEENFDTLGMKSEAATSDYDEESNVDGDEDGDVEVDRGERQQIKNDDERSRKQDKSKDGVGEGHQEVSELVHERKTTSRGSSREVESKNKNKNYNSKEHLAHNTSHANAPTQRTPQQHSVSNVTSHNHPSEQIGERIAVEVKGAEPHQRTRARSSSEESSEGPNPSPRLVPKYGDLSKDGHGNLLHSGGRSTASSSRLTRRPIPPRSRPIHRHVPIDQKSRSMINADLEED